MSILAFINIQVIAPTGSVTPCTGDNGPNAGTTAVIAGANGKCIITKVALGLCGPTTSINIQHYQIAVSFNTSSEVILVAYDDDGGSGEPGTILGKTTAFQVTPGLFSTYGDTGWKSWISNPSLDNDIWIGACYEYSGTAYKYNATGASRLLTVGDFENPGNWDTGSDTPETREVRVQVRF